jgi:hypothetical protein
MGLYGNKKTLTCSWVGCPGLSIPVRWPNGASAYICTTDTVPYRDGWQVLRHANASHPMPKGAWLVN